MVAGGQATWGGHGSMLFICWKSWGLGVVFGDCFGFILFCFVFVL